MTAESDQSHLRIFLSADLVGSTKLKTQLNHRELLDKYRSRRNVIEKYVKQLPGHTLSGDEVESTILESLAVSTEDYDWASVVESFYRDFHNEFVSNLEKSRAEEQPLKFSPWKAVGDELIYQFIVRTRLDLHWFVIAFVSAIRNLDSKFADRLKDHGVGIKGSGWVAGFPVRNRVIKLPVIETEDFLGPDIDVGFRIGKFTREGMLVVSVELAELLAEVPHHLNPVLGCIVGWEELKGVWNGKRYPIVWIDLPSGYPASSSAQSARRFNDWQQEECKLCKTWEQTETKQPLRLLASRLVRLREGLPKSLGLVDPYIVNDICPDNPDSDVVPAEHREILKLISLIESHQTSVNSQDGDGYQTTTTPDPSSIVEKLFE